MRLATQRKSLAPTCDYLPVRLTRALRHTVIFSICQANLPKQSGEILTQGFARKLKCISGCFPPFTKIILYTLILREIYGTAGGKDGGWFHASICQKLH